MEHNIYGIGKLVLITTENQGDYRIRVMGRSFDFLLSNLRKVFLSPLVWSPKGRGQKNELWFSRKELHQKKK